MAHMECAVMEFGLDDDEDYNSNGDQYQNA